MHGAATAVLDQTKETDRIKLLFFLYTQYTLVSITTAEIVLWQLSEKVN